MLAAQRLEFANQFPLPPESELCLDPLLDRREMQLLQPLDLDPQQTLQVEIRQRPTAPKRISCSQRTRRRRRITCSERLSPVGHQSLELVQVELARLDAEQISRRTRDQPRGVRSRCGERLPQSRHLIP